MYSRCFIVLFQTFLFFVAISQEIDGRAYHRYNDLKSSGDSESDLVPISADESNFHKIERLQQDMNEVREIINGKDAIINALNGRIEVLETDVKDSKTSNRNSPKMSVDERVIFLANIRNQIYLPRGQITGFNEVLLNLPNNNFEASTGIFEVPTKGSYIFAIDGMVDGNCPGGFVRLYINGADYKHFFNYNNASPTNWRNLNGFTSVQLTEGDILYLVNDRSDCVMGSDTLAFNFMGMLVS